MTSQLQYGKLGNRQASCAQLFHLNSRDCAQILSALETHLCLYRLTVLLKKTLQASASITFWLSLTDANSVFWLVRSPDFWLERSASLRRHRRPGARLPRGNLGDQPLLANLLDLGLFGCLGVWMFGKRWVGLWAYYIFNLNQVHSIYECIYVCIYVCMNVYTYT